MHGKRPILRSILKQMKTWYALLLLVVVNFPSKNTSNRSKVLLGKDKEAQERFDSQKQPANCVSQGNLS